MKMKEVLVKRQVQIKTQSSTRFGQVKRRKNMLRYLRSMEKTLLKSRKSFLKRRLLNARTFS